MSYLINQITSAGVATALGFTPVAITAAGNMQVPAGVVKDTTANVATHVPTTGQTITLVKGSNLINPAGTLLALTAAFPTSPIEGDIVRMAYSQIITGLTLTSASTIVAALTAAVVGTVGTWQFIGSAWYKL